jgi:hypothetical protein
MIKKVFVGVLLAAAFGLLVFGAVKRTLAKSDGNEPLALSTNLSEGEDKEGANINQNKNQSLNKSLEKNLNQGGQGRGQGTGDCDEEENQEGSEYGKGADGQWNGSGKGQGGQPENMTGEGLGVGQAEVDERVTVTGTVVSIDSELLVIELSDGSLLEVEGRVLSFINENGFEVSAGDELKITGLYEGDTFEVIQITNDGSGQTIHVRDQSGRPLWAGGGRQIGGGED